MAIVPVPHTFVDGVYSTSEANTYLRDPLLFLMKRPMARLRQIVAQSIPSGAFTPITFTFSDVDQDYLTAANAGHSNSVNTSRYTANFAGWYLATGGVSFAVNAVGVRAAYWYVNGTPANGVESMGATVGTVNFGTVARSELIYLNVGDYLELNAYQTSGAGLNTVAGATGVGASTMNVIWQSN